MKKYTNILFDLDHTLWDFDRNSTETLNQLFDRYGLAESERMDRDEFLKKFREVNLTLWRLYDRNEISKDYLRKERFKIVLRSLNAANDEMALNLGMDYFLICPEKPHLIPHAGEVLDYLYKRYRLFIITNGFTETQKKKLAFSKLDKYFIKMITSEEAGHKKPHRGIFEYALSEMKSKSGECIMVGDNIETDIRGAKSVGMDIVFFNPDRIKHKEEVTYEITSLMELKKIF